MYKYLIILNTVGHCCEQMFVLLKKKVELSTFAKNITVAVVETLHFFVSITA